MEFENLKPQNPLNPWRTCSWWILPWFLGWIDVRLKTCYWGLIFTEKQTTRYQFCGIWTCITPSLMNHNPCWNPFDKPLCSWVLEIEPWFDWLFDWKFDWVLLRKIKHNFGYHWIVKTSWKHRIWGLKIDLKRVWNKLEKSFRLGAPPKPGAPPDLATA